MLRLLPRELQTLQAAFHYTKQYKAHPSCQDIADRIHCCRKTAWSRLAHLRLLGLLVVHRSSDNSGYVLTPQAYAHLKAKPIYIPHDTPRRKTRNNLGKYITAQRKRKRQARLTAAAYDMKTLPVYG